MGLTRRDSLQILISGIISAAFFGFVKVSGAKALPRPPGSLEEKSFLKFCTRCYRCLDVCPADAIHPAGITGGIANFGTPVLDWKKCIFCMACTRACPTGAIQRIDRDDVDIGNAVIERRTCLAWTGQSKCSLCFDACRYDAIVLEKGIYPVVLEDLCTGCGLCERKCPTDPKSIVVYYDKVKRMPPPEKRLMVRLEEEEERRRPDGKGFREWLEERVKKLGRSHGLIREEEEEE